MLVEPISKLPRVMTTETVSTLRIKIRIILFSFLGGGKRGSVLFLISVWRVTSSLPARPLYNLASFQDNSRNRHSFWLMCKFSDLSSLIQWWCGQKQWLQGKRRRLTFCGYLAPRAAKLYFWCPQNEMPQKSVLTTQVISPSSKFTPQFIHSVTLTGTVHT